MPIIGRVVEEKLRKLRSVVVRIRDAESSTEEVNMVTLRGKRLQEGQAVVKP